MSDDEFSPEEIAEFEGLEDETKTKIERFIKWAGLKESHGEPVKPPKPNQAGSMSGSGDWSLKQLKELIADQDAKSILQHLLEQSETSPKPTKPGANKSKSNASPDAPEAPELPKKKFWL